MAERDTGPAAAAPEGAVVVNVPAAEEIRPAAIAPHALGSSDLITQESQIADWVTKAKEQASKEATNAETRIRQAVLEQTVIYMERAYTADIEYTANGLLTYRRIGDIFEWLSLVLSALSSVLAYLAGIEKSRWWAFVSGITGTVALGLAAVGRYCNSQSKERTQQLNKLLGRFGLPPYPDVVLEYSTGELQALSQSGGGTSAYGASMQRQVGRLA